MNKLLVIQNSHEQTHSWEFPTWQIVRVSVLKHSLYVLCLQMSNNIPGLEKENDSEDVDVKHEPLEPDVDDYVSISA